VAIGGYFEIVKQVCEHCGKTYTPTRRKQITCGSYECKLSRKRQLWSINQDKAAHKVIANHKMTKAALKARKIMDVARIGHPWAEDVESYSEDFR